jgi:predicted DNA-binding transcriptional regulator AlpA
MSTNAKGGPPAIADPLLTGPQVAGRLGIDSATWRGYVHRGYAPPPNDPGDTSLPVNRRTPKWRQSTVDQWQAARRTQSWRAGLTSGPSE